MLAFPFDSRVEVVENPITHEPETQFDRAVSSQPMRHLMRKLFTTGVMPDLSDNYLVSAGTDGMTVVVHSGFAVVDGGLALETEDRTLEVTAADTTLDRIDTVVLRWNENVDVRTADLYVVSGTPAANPVRPELQRGESIYEIGLADIFITRSVATITNEKITDTRYEAERCGVVRSISEYDTTYIYQQVQADLAEFKSTEQAEFLSWLETLENILDENTAGHLQNEIDGLDERLSPFEEAIQSYTNGLGNASIKGIGDGTLLGAINELNNDLTAIREEMAEMGKLRVVKTGSGTTSNDSPVTIKLGETIPVDKYYVIIDSDVGNNGSVFTGCVRLETKTTTSFTLKAAHSNNTAYGYQVIAFN